MHLWGLGNSSGNVHLSMRLNDSTNQNLKVLSQVWDNFGQLKTL